MNNVVFVMGNSKLGKKKQARKESHYNMEDLSSNDDCVVEDAENVDDGLDLPFEELFPLQVEDEHVGLAPLDDLEIPNLDRLDLEDGGDDMDGDRDKDDLEEEEDDVYSP